MIALSSGEAEYYGIVKGSSTGLGMASVLQGLGHPVKVTVYTDSSAAKSLASRKGLGKARHIEVNLLWVQQKVSEGLLELRKVKGTENISDALTKHLDNEGIQKHMRETLQSIRPDRHDLMPHVAMRP